MIFGLPSSRRRRRARAALAFVLALALPGAPLARIGAACDACPPTCPMHAHEGTADSRGCHRGAKAASARAERGCHRAQANAAVATAKPDRTHCGRIPGLVAPGCQARHQLPISSLGDAVLPVTRPLASRLDVTRVALLDPSVDGRYADPPDSPPPILSA